LLFANLSSVVTTLKCRRYWCFWSSSLTSCQTKYIQSQYSEFAHFLCCIKLCAIFSGPLCIYVCLRRQQ